ncbi:MAG: ATP-binding cassette domain-containing protein [Bifidobacteriaceae bacterium]|jgi:ABC-type lipoprotein export system ATPase subunit|nr:ATP-binding cassette domain-containing protein [Bifidobacteriaceae bacterium]
MCLKVSDLTFAYPHSEPLIDGLELEIERGSSAAIMAPSGVGKTTLLTLLGGLRKPTHGEIRISQTGNTNNRFPRPDTGWIFQAMHLMPRRTCLDNVTIGALARGLARPLAESQAHQALDTFDLAEYAQRRLNTLSGGQSQRVAVARVAVCDPHLVLADEPTANLDRANADHVATVLVKGFPQAALVLATHDPTVAARADQIYELRQGRLWPRHV